MDTTAHVEYLTVKQLADERGVTTRTVRRWIAHGWVEAKRTADDHGHWRIKVLRFSKAAS